MSFSIIIPATAIEASFKVLSWNIGDRKDTSLSECPNTKEVTNMDHVSFYNGNVELHYCGGNKLMSTESTIKRMLPSIENILRFETVSHASHRGWLAEVTGEWET